MILLSSCKKEYSLKQDLKYINETNHTISLYRLSDSLFLKPLDTGFVYGKVSYHERKVPITEFNLPSTIVLLKYDDLKCDSLDSYEGVRRSNNYEYEDLGNQHYQYLYRFTEADYERAVDCE